MRLRAQEHRKFRKGDRTYAFVVPANALVELDATALAVLEAAGDSGGPDADQIERVLEGCFPPGEIREAIGELVRMAILLPAEKLELWADSAFPPAPPDVPLSTLVLNVAQDCNMRCSYCFAAAGTYGKAAGKMNQETAFRAVDFFLARCGDSKEVTLTFFGGEPLLNFEVIRTTVKYAREEARKVGKAVDFSLTTNGTLLDEEKIRFLSEERIGVTVSMDGPPEVHDRHRRLRGGQGSYRMVLPGVLALIRGHRTRPVGARATLTRGIPDLERCLFHLLDMGFHEVGFSPVTSPDPDCYLNEADLESLLGQFRRLACLFRDRALEGRFLGFSNISNLVAEIHAGEVKRYPCGAGLGLMGVSATGDLFLCHRLVENEEAYLGSLGKGIDRQRRGRLLRALHLSRKADCRGCWVRHLCAGGCYQEALERQGSLSRRNAQYCEWLRAWIGIGIEVYLDILEGNPSFFEKFLSGRRVAAAAATGIPTSQRIRGHGGER